MSGDYELGFLKEQIAALTARVFRLEQEVAATRREPQAQTQPSEPLPHPIAPINRPSPVQPPPSQPPRLQPQPPRFATVTSRQTDQESNLERKIGQYWLNRVGIVAMLIGVSYFLKYAFDSNWIGPSGRVGLGLLAGIGLIVWSEWFRNRGHAPFSYSLKAVGIGTLYLSLWAGYRLYAVIPSSVAFVAMVIVTASMIVLALTQDAELLAAFALMGGFATPALVSSGENHEAILFFYVLLLDVALLWIARYRPWRRLLWLNFVGTIVLSWGWAFDYYRDDARGITVLFAAILALVFASIPLVTPFGKSSRGSGPSITLTLLPLLNAVVFFVEMFMMHLDHKATLTWYALGLAAVYLGISNAFSRRFPHQDTSFVNLLHVAIAVAFITIAVPLKLGAHWVTIGWLIESAVLLWVAARTKTAFLGYLAATALGLGIFRLLLFDYFRGPYGYGNIESETLFLNMRFLTYLVAIAVLGAIIRFGPRYASSDQRTFISIAQVILNLLVLIAFTLEASSYFDRQRYSAMQQHPSRSYDFGGLEIEREFSYSAIYLVYGAILMFVGFRQRSAFVRWQALILIGFTIVKVFIYDVSQLDKGYRILSLVALGAVLLGISFIYQRDWLKLSSHPPKDSPQEHPAP